MSDELPDGWRRIRLCELLAEPLANGRSVPDGDGFPVLRLTALKDGRVDLRERKSGAWRSADATRFRVRKGDFLVARGNGSLALVGRGGLVEQEPDAVAYPDTAIRVRPDATVLSPEYLRAVWGSAEVRQQMEAAAHTTAGIHKISQRDLSGIEVPVPPPSEQRRIVERLELLLAGVNVARERLALVPAILKRLRQAILAAACSGRLTEAWREHHPEVRFETKPTRNAPTVEQDSLPELPDIPESWQLVEVRDIAQRLQYGSNDKADAVAGKGVPILRMGNIQDGAIDLRDLKYVDRGGDLGEFMLCVGDMLFNRTNSPELVGKAAVFDADEEMVFASYLVRVTVRSEVALPEYVCAWINSPWGRHWARAVRTDGVSQSNINATKLAEMPLPLPPLEEQREIVDRVQKFVELGTTVASRVSAATARANKLTQSILARAISGELVPTEAQLARQEGRAYESASDLLERLRSERVVGPRAKKAKRTRASSQPKVL